MALLVAYPRGNYSFLKGIGAYSSGAIADPGFEIVHAVLARPVGIRGGFSLIARHLSNLGRPVQAICGIELRSPRPFTFAGFAEFNDSYRAVLAEVNLLSDGMNPIARTNVAPEVDPTGDPVLYGFTYTAPSRTANSPASFVVAGAGELLDDQYDDSHIVRRGETSDEAMRDKATCVLDHISRRVTGLGASLDDVRVVNVYTIRNIFPFLQHEIIGRVGAAARHGIRWHFARPPIDGLEFEMDVRSGGMEIVLT